ncbi:hypothetical protein ALC62_01223 [Cyphomyrmex costatus]|uniref:Uncharacterized protein n=1 Tax=Cyphomyrmex costatus TaxID=456900 RepID=A0A195D4A2_9HYME|nr:hypothetical protein ALC62_01223 [Cyphomyrmex costatus]
MTSGYRGYHTHNILLTLVAVSTTRLLQKIMLVVGKAKPAQDKSDRDQNDEDEAFPEVAEDFRRSLSYNR